MPMKIPVFCAGALQVRWSYFISVVLSARIIRYFALAYLGRHYGRETFHFLVSHLPFVIVVAAALAVVSVLVLRLMDQDKPPRTPSSLDNGSASR
jgi:uncharacterized membrane protein YdjX (TVP38/TMEM64 family)